MDYPLDSAFVAAVRELDRQAKAAFDRHAWPYVSLRLAEQLSFYRRDKRRARLPIWSRYGFGRTRKVRG